MKSRAGQNITAAIDAAAAAIPIGGNLATKQDIAGLRADIGVLKLVVFRFLLPAQFLIIGLAVKAAFFPG